MKPRVKKQLTANRLLGQIHNLDKETTRNRKNKQIYHETSPQMVTCVRAAAGAETQTPAFALIAVLVGLFVFYVTLFSNAYS